MLDAIHAALVAQAVDLLAVTGDLGGLRIGHDGRVRQALQLAHQHGIGLQLAGEFQQRDVAHEAGQVDGRFHTRVATADHGHALALEQRAIAVRAIGHALVLVFLLARHVHVAPAGAGRQDDRAALEHRAVGQRHLGKAARLVRRRELDRALRVHDVDLVLAHVLLQRGGKLRPFGLLHGDEVFNAQRVEHLTAKTLSHHAGANALARRVHGSRRTCRATADDQHVKRFLGGKLFSVPCGSAGVDLGEDFFHAHAARAEGLAVQEHGRHGHDLARLDFALIQRAVNGDVLDARVDHGHHVQRLNHIRAVLARERHVGLEAEIPFDIANLFDDVGFELGRIAAHLQQRQHERGELVTGRDGGKTHAHIGAGATDQERRRTLGGVTLFGQHDHAGLLGHVAQQVDHVAGALAVIDVGDQLNGLHEAFEVGLQLGLDISIQHDDFLCIR